MMTGEVLDAGHAVQVAERLDQDNPDWIVLYGSYTREFVAFPVYPDAPDNCYCSAMDRPRWTATSARPSGAPGTSG